MIFSSLEFIFGFLPVFLILYYITPYPFKNVTLLLGSLYFYAVGEPVYVVLIIVSLLVNYVISRWLNGRAAKFWLVMAILLNTGVLIVFKYTNFIIENSNLLLETKIPAVELVLPLGISFYTFQIIAYVTDVYKGKITTKRSLINFATYICMFPKLVSGPIALYSEIENELNERKIQVKDLEEGIKLFIIGLASKVLIADKAAILWHEIQTVGFESISTPLAWLGAIAFSIQIYFDFNGYSLMAIGLGKFLGFSLPVNFRQPYTAKSLTEFWQRWHITLGRWFREYLYIPLGGNREGKAKMVRNLLLIWILTGLWHGAAWNFVLWGVTTFVFIIIEKAVLKKWLDKSIILSRIYMLLVLPTTWMMFAIGNLGDLVLYLKRMFPFWSGKLLLYGNLMDWQKYIPLYGIFLIAGVLLSTSVPAKCYEKYRTKLWMVFLLFTLFWVSVYEMINAVNNPFLYFRF